MGFGFYISSRASGRVLPQNPHGPNNLKSFKTLMTYILKRLGGHQPPVLNRTPKPKSPAEVHVKLCGLGNVRGRMDGWMDGWGRPAGICGLRTPNKSLSHSTLQAQAAQLPAGTQDECTNHYRLQGFANMSTLCKRAETFVHGDASGGLAGALTLVSRTRQTIASHRALAIQGFR